MTIFTQTPMNMEHAGKKIKYSKSDNFFFKKKMNETNILSETKIEKALKTMDKNVKRNCSHCN